jgi:hypothetical protein
MVVREIMDMISTRELARSLRLDSGIPMNPLSRVLFDNCLRYSMRRPGKYAGVELFDPAFEALANKRSRRAVTGQDYDDFISLEFFLSRFRRFSGNVYVMSPYPSELADVIAHGIDSDRVYPIPTRWNVLSHAMVEALWGRRVGKSLNYFCEQLLDRYGHDKMAFPLT